MLEGVYFLSEGRLFTDTPTDDGLSLNVTSWIVFLTGSILESFFLIGIHSMLGWTATTWHGVTWKEAQKWLQDTENLFRKNLELKDGC